MTNGSESLFDGLKRSNLETLFDVVYVLAKEYEPLRITQLLYKTNLNLSKLKEFLKIGEKKGFVYDYEVGRIKKYELTPHGKEFIYTWLDFVDRFDAKDLLRSMYVESLPEKENSKLEEIMKKTWKKPNYKKSSQEHQRTPIIVYRDFLFYLKLPKPKVKYQENIREKVNINNTNYKVIIERALKKNHIEIKFSPGYGIRKWEHSVAKKGDLEVFQIKPMKIRHEKARMKRISPYIPGQVDKLISITDSGSEFVKTFDKIMMEYNLTDLVYTSKNF